MSSFPVTRLRRLRRTAALRDLVRETRLDLDANKPEAIRNALRHTHASTSSTASPRRRSCANASASASLANSASPVNANNERHKRGCTARYTASTRS